MRRRSFTTHYTPEPFREGCGTLVITDKASGRRQHMPIRPNMTRTEFLRRARHHLRVVKEPYPPWTPPPIRFRRSREDDDDQLWT